MRNDLKPHETTYNDQEMTWNDLQQARNDLKWPKTSKTTYNDLNIPTTSKEKMQNDQQQADFQIILQYGANSSLL